MAELTDDDLMLLFRDGDAAAFDALFDRWRTPVYNFARLLLGNRAAAEDLLQESFLAVSRAARRYEPRGRFRAWLMRIVRNRCLNRLEAERRRATVGESGLALAEAVPSGDPAMPLAAAEEADRLRAALAALPERQREAIALYAFERMSYAEIAETLDAPINTVKTLIHRARAALAEAMEET